MVIDVGSATKLTNEPIEVCVERRNVNAMAPAPCTFSGSSVAQCPIIPMLLHWHQTLANSAIVQVTANHKMAIEEVLE